jgi:hypothetical protein
MLLSVTLTLSLLACTGDDGTDDSIYAVDTDGNGVVDCSDLEHVQTCVHHPESDVCAVADVNEDGVVDDADLHDIYAGLAETGHHCDEPDHHDPDDPEHAAHE